MKIWSLIHIYFWLTSQFVVPRGPEPNFYQLDCRIYNEEAVLVATFAGFTCAFADDGDWLSLQQNALMIFDSRNQLKYTFPYFVHHELRFSPDQKRIYFLSSDIRMFKGKKTRFDVLNVADRNGKLLYTWNSADHSQELIQSMNLEYLEKAMPFPIDRTTLPGNVTHEFSHFNAIAEIPPNPLEFVLPYMKRGNLLVTFNGVGKIVIFDPKLGRIIHVFGDFLELNDYGFHDAQILPNGHLTFFKNINDRESGPYTTLEEYNVLLKKRTWRFKFAPAQFQLNKINGTIQVLGNNNVFISDNSYGGRALEMTREGRIVWSKQNERMDDETKLPVMIYRAKKIYADRFFQNNITGATLK